MERQRWTIGLSLALFFLFTMTARSQPQTVDELEHLFEVDPAQGFVEAERMFQAPYETGDLARMAALIRVTGEWGWRCAYFTPVERMTEAAVPVATEAGRWKLVGDFQLARARALWNRQTDLRCLVTLPPVLRRSKHFAGLAAEAYARAGVTSEALVELQECAEENARLTAEDVWGYKDQLLPPHREIIDGIETAVAEGRDADALQAMRELTDSLSKMSLSEYRSAPRATDDPKRKRFHPFKMAIMYVARQLWLPGAADLIPQLQWLGEKRLHPLGAGELRALLTGSLYGSLFGMSGLDDPHNAMMHWCYDRSYEGPRYPSPRLPQSWMWKLQQFGRFAEVDSIARDWVHREMTAHRRRWGHGASALVHALTPPDLRRALVDLDLLSYRPTSAPSEPALTEKNTAVLREMIAKAPPNQFSTWAVETADALIQIGTTYPSAGSRALAAEEAARLYRDSGRDDLAGWAGALAVHLAQQDPATSRKLALMRAYSEAAWSQWGAVVELLAGTCADWPASADTVEACLLITHAHLNRNDPASARKWYRRASDAIDRAGLSAGEKVGYLKSLASLAEDEDSKVRMLERASDAARASGLEMLQESVDRQLAQVALEAGRLGAAQEALIDLIDRSEARRYRLALDPRLRQHWFADHIGPYRQLMRVAAIEADAQLALACGERMRSRVLMDQLAWKQVDLQVELPDHLRQRLSDLRTMRQRAYGLLTKVMGGGEREVAQADADDESGEYTPARGLYMPIRGLYMPIRGPLSGGEPTSDDAMRLASMLDDLASEEAALEGAIREQVPAYARAAQTTIPSGTQLAAEIAKHPGLAVLHYTFADEGLTVVGACGVDLKVRLIEDDREALYEQIGRFREAIWERSDDAYTHARDLYRTLVAPVEGILSGAERLWIVADGAVQLVPFAALVDAQDRYIGTRMSIAFAPSLTLALSTSDRQETPSREAVVVAAPETGASDTAIADAETDDKRGKDMPIRGMYIPIRGTYMPIRGEGEVSSSLTAMAGVPLPEAQTEGAAVAGLYEDPVLLTGAEATKSALGEVGGDCKVLHIATHGYADPDFPDFSGLLLCAPEGSKTPYEVLTAGEVYGWPLKAELVTLSACQTALGRDVEGEGILGLSRAFLYAGAEQVVCSLWPVSDASTRRLMVAFYEALEDGASVEKALQEGQKVLSRDKDTSHPFYWAGFIAVRGPE